MHFNERVSIPSMEVDRLRIAMVDPSAFTIPYDTHLCRSLYAAGHHVTLFTRGARQDDYFASPQETSLVSPTSFATDEHFYRRTQRGGWFSSHSRFQLAYKAAEHLSDMRSLVKRLQKLQPTVIHFQWLVMPAIDPHFIKRLRKIAPVFLTVHDAEAFHSPTSKFQLLGWKTSLNCFDGLIAHTQNTRQTLESMGIPPERIAILPHGLLEHSPGTPHDSKAHTSPGICRLLLFGSIKPYKGLDTLLEALSLVHLSTRQRLLLTVAGKSQQPEATLRRLASDLGIDDQIDWRFGFIHDGEVSQLFHECEVVVFPYHRIDASGALMTALPFHKAIIASQLGQFDELLENRRSALLIAPGQPQALADAITQCVESPKLRQDLAKGATEVSTAVPSWDDIAARTVEFYQRTPDRSA